MKIKLIVVLATISFFLIFSNQVNAYLDPGTGSYIFQLLIAGVFGGLFALKIFWGKLKRVLRNIFSTRNNNVLF